IGASGEIVEFCGFRLPDGRVQGNGAVFRMVEISIFLLKTSFSTAWFMQEFHQITSQITKNPALLQDFSATSLLRCLARRRL
ncbi:hypothetical protein, partial [uncultured Paenibacillus sp.]|uniref:hypothetical protein n=1 Tax=uncultured Paenibacillus sp. TaxID=227322 RepID=UPI0025CC630C